jgi:hypothetical protein
VLGAPNQAAASFRRNARRRLTGVGIFSDDDFGVPIGAWTKDQPASKTKRT